MQEEIERIQATIDQRALERVSRFFNASQSETLHEVLQNARRSGATKVDIELDAGRIAIRDDGAGIATAAALLAFGGSEWDAATRDAEDAAGMGCYALATRKSVIRSRTAGGRGWRVVLGPEHFTGKTPATVVADETAPAPHGTSVEFEWENKKNYWNRTVDDVAEHFPLPVTINGRAAEQTPFLDGAARIETTAGARIGAFAAERDGDAERPKLCFHGRSVRARRMPRTRDRNRTLWYAAAEVIDAGQVPLVLPARHEAIESPGLEKLRRAAQRVIWRAMADAGAAADHETWEAARDEGITLPIPEPVLARWEPTPAESNSASWYGGRYGPQEYRKAGRESLVVRKLSAAMDTMIARASELDPSLRDRLVRADDALAGYEWYDELTQIERILLVARNSGGGKHRIADSNGERCDLPENRETKTIVLELRTRTGNGRPGETITIATDVALHAPEEDWCGTVDEVTAVIADGSTINVTTLSEMITTAYFLASDDVECDSFETQKRAFEEDAQEYATRLLLNEAEALRQRVANAVSDLIAWYVPSDKTVTIRVERATDGPRSVSVEVTDSAAA